MITAVDLTRYYGTRIGVEGVSFTIEKGEIVGLLGPNGAGKSTIMKMLAGYQLPTAGSIQINGRDIVELMDGGMTDVGFMPENPPLYPEMEVEELLSFTSSIKGVPSSLRKQHVEELMNLTKIIHVKDRLVKNLSKGYRQRVGMAQALVGYPDNIILDEPTVGMDPAQIHEVRNMLRSLKKEHAVIVSSHILSEIAMLCDRIMVIHKGHLVLTDSMEHLKSGMMDDDRFLLSTTAPQEVLKEHLLDFPEIFGIQKAGENRYLIMAEDSDELRQKVSRRLVEQGIPLLEIKKSVHTLEEIFLKLTSEV